MIFVCFGGELRTAHFRLALWQTMARSSNQMISINKRTKVSSKNSIGPLTMDEILDTFMPCVQRNVTYQRNATYINPH